MERVYFQKTLHHGVVWTQSGTFTLRERFALVWWPPLTHPVMGGIAGSLVAGVALFVVTLFAGSLDDSASPEDNRLVYLVVGAGMALGVALSVLAGLTLQRMKKSRNFRFGDMLEESKPSAPSLQVLREYEEATRPLNEQPLNTQLMLNDWLMNTWDDDATWLETRDINRAMRQDYLNGMLCWVAVRDRIDSLRVRLPSSAVFAFNVATSDLLERREERAVEMLEVEMSRRFDGVRRASKARGEVVRVLDDFRKTAAQAALG